MRRYSPRDGFLCRYQRYQRNSQKMRKPLLLISDITEGEDSIETGAATYKYTKRASSQIPPGLRVHQYYPQASNALAQGGYHRGAHPDSLLPGYLRNDAALPDCGSAIPQCGCPIETQRHLALLILFWLYLHKQRTWLSNPTI